MEARNCREGVGREWEANEQVGGQQSGDERAGESNRAGFPQLRRFPTSENAAGATAGRIAEGRGSTGKDRREGWD